MNHRDLTKLTGAGVFKEIDRDREIVEQITGVRMIRVMRPPYGLYNKLTLRQSARAGFPTLLLWDTTASDTSRHSSERSMLKAALSGRNGSVVVLHCGPKATPRILRRIIKGYRARGFAFVTIPSSSGSNGRRARSIARGSGGRCSTSGAGSHRGSMSAANRDRRSRASGRVAHGLEAARLEQTTGGSVLEAAVSSRSSHRPVVGALSAPGNCLGRCPTLRSMRNADIRDLFGYLYWIRDRVLAAADEAGPDALQAIRPGTSRDLRATLVHELDVELGWRARLSGGEEVDLDPADFPTIDAIAEHWRRDEAEMQRWLATLTDEALAAPPPRETDQSFPLWYYLVHVVSHGIQELEEAVVLLGAVRALAAEPWLPRLRGHGRPGSARPSPRQ